MKDYVLNRGGLTDAAADRMYSKPWSKACREKSAEVIVPANGSSREGLNPPQQSRPEAEGTAGVQTFMRVVDGCLTTEQPNRYPLLEQILSPANLNAAYKQVMRNKGASGIDRMDCDRLLGYLLEHKDALTESIRQRTYRPNPVRRVEIPQRRKFRFPP